MIPLRTDEYTETCSHMEKREKGRRVWRALATNILDRIITITLAVTKFIGSQDERTGSDNMPILKPHPQGAFFTRAFGIDASRLQQVEDGGEGD